MLGGLSGVKLLPMTRQTASLLLALALGGCAYDKIDPPANEAMTGPELSHPREPRKSADPPPPIREDLYRNRTQHGSELAPVRTSSTLIDSRANAPSSGRSEPGPTVIEPGVVNPLR